MTQKTASGERANARIARIAWLVCFAVPLLLLAIMSLTHSAGASAEGAGPAPAFESPAGTFEEEEEGEEECEEASGEDEEAAEEECEAEARESGPPSAEECLLRTARARAIAFPQRDQVRLTLGYTTYEPARATIEYAHGTDRLGTASRALGRSGVLRLSKRLGEDEMRRLRGSSHFTVTVRMAGAPPRCEQLEMQRLTVQQASDVRVAWSASD